MKTNIRSTYRLIRANWKRLFLIEIIYKFILFFLIVPLISLGFNIALRFTKYSYITTENIFRFIVYPQTILVVLLTIIILALFIQVETASLFFFYEDCKNHQKHSIAQLIIAGVRSLFSILFRRKSFLVPFISMGIALFLNIPLIVMVVTKAGIPSYLMKSFFKFNYSRTALAVVTLIIFLFAYRRIFVLPLCILDRKTYKEAKKMSAQQIKQNRGLFLFQLFGVNLVLAFVYVFVYVICFCLLIVGINLFVKKQIAIPLFLQNYDQLNRIILIGISVIGAVVNYSMISNVFVRATVPTIKEVVVDENSHNAKEKLQANLRKQLKNFVIVLCCLCAITAYSYFYNVIRNGTFNAEEALLGIQITAHRGNSISAPENTLPAVQSAIDCFADYAEIDVQLTKDGEVVLCHDANLVRTAGVRKKISDLKYEDLLKYDVGAFFSDEYVGTTVPTLAQVLELCKGKIKLNIELKRISKQKELVDKVAALIDEYDFDRQCVITSMSYEALKMVKETNSNIKTGYIMSIAFGNFYDNDNIDFFSMKAGIVDENVVKKAHTLGKEVYVWTVNSKTEITRLSALGVDNIITDKPVYVQEVLYKVDDTSLLQYVKMILK